MTNGSYTYDANGNTLTDAQGRSFTWDFENRLTLVVNPGVGTTNYLYDGFNDVEEVDNSGNVLARYTQDQAIDQPMSEWRSGTASNYESDGIGSVTSLSNTTGALANSYAYDSFGKLTAFTGAVANPFQYTGRDFDAETGLFYFRARYYDSGIARFISEDPNGVVSENSNCRDGKGLPMGRERRVVP